MPKDKRKIYKAVKKTIDGVDFIMVKFKNLARSEVSELRTEINILTTDFFVVPEPEEYDEKHVQFQGEEELK